MDRQRRELMTYLGYDSPRYGSPREPHIQPVAQRALFQETLRQLDWPEMTLGENQTYQDGRVRALVWAITGIDFHQDWRERGLREAMHEAIHIAAGVSPPLETE